MSKKIKNNNKNNSTPTQNTQPQVTPKIKKNPHWHRIFSLHSPKVFPQLLGSAQTRAKSEVFFASCRFPSGCEKYFVSPDILQSERRKSFLKVWQHQKRKIFLIISTWMKVLYSSRTSIFCIWADNKIIWPVRRSWGSSHHSFSWVCYLYATSAKGNCRHKHPSSRHRKQLRD